MEASNNFSFNLHAARIRRTLRQQSQKLNPPFSESARDEEEETLLYSNTVSLYCNNHTAKPVYLNVAVSSQVRLRPLAP
jgi:hypothetical protein